MNYITTAVQTPDILSTALQGSAVINNKTLSPSYNTNNTNSTFPMNNNITPGFIMRPTGNTSSSTSTLSSNSPGPALDEATALMFAAERGAVRSIQAWMARGGDINGTLVQQVSYYFISKSLTVVFLNCLLSEIYSLILI